VFEVCVWVGARLVAMLRVRLQARQVRGWKQVEEEGATLRFDRTTFSITYLVNISQMRHT
jgi:hypothetical protein